MAVPSAIAAMLAGAKCFKCLPPPVQFEVQTYIIAYIAGLGTDPKTLAALAKDFQRLDTATLLEVKAYLLAYQSGFTIDANALSERAKCYFCIPDGFMGEIQTYLLAMDPSGPGITDPNQLAAAAKDFLNWPIKTLLEIQVYLLATIAGLAADPTTLSSLAKCLTCLPFPILTNVITQVLNHLEVGDDEGGGGGITGGTTCVDDPAQQVPVISGTYTGGVLSSVDVLLPQVCCNPRNVTVYEADDAIGTGAVAIASGLIAASHAGEINYVMPTFVLGAAPAKAYVLATQTCLGGAESGYSNALTVDNTCGTATSIIIVTGAGDANANGYYTWDQTEYDSTGRFTYANADTNWMIEFVNGTGGVEAYMYDDLLNVAYHLPLGSCFPCGDWARSGADTGTDPAPTCEWGTTGLEAAWKWADRVVTNGGARPAESSILAAADFHDAISAGGFLSKMISVNIVAPDNSIASRTPLIANSGANTLWTEAGTPGALDLTVNGAKPTNSSYGQNVATNVRAVLAAAGGSNGDVGLTTYIYTSSNEALSNFGVAQGAEWLWLHEYHNVGAIIFFTPNQTTGDCRWVTGIKTGFISASNETTSLARMYFANSTTAFSKVKETTTGPHGNDVPAQALFAVGSQIVGTGYFTSTNRRSSFFALHRALTQAQTQILYNAVQALRTALGGGFV